MFKHIVSLFKAFTVSPASQPDVANSQAEISEPEVTPKLDLSPAKFATRVYVDLDNTLSQLNPDIQKAILAKPQDFIFALAAQFQAPVKLSVYGNLSHWGLSVQTWFWQDWTVDFIDTPVEKNRRGKTITDEIMITHISRQASAECTTVLVSCDVGFSPVLKDIAENDNVRTELVLFGYASYQLKESVFVQHCGMDVLSRSGLLTTKMARRVLLQSLCESPHETIALPTVALWLGEFKAEWRHQGFKSYLMAVLPTDWVIDSGNNQIKRRSPLPVQLQLNDAERDSLYRKLSLPECSHAQFKVIFENAAQLKTRDINAIKDAITEALRVHELPQITDADIGSVLNKIQPQLVAKKRPRQLADAYLRFLLQKARLMKLHLARHERLFLSRLLWS